MNEASFQKRYPWADIDRPLDLPACTHMEGYEKLLRNESGTSELMVVPEHAAEFEEAMQETGTTWQEHRRRHSSKWSGSDIIEAATFLLLGLSPLLYCLWIFIMAPY